MVEWRAGLDQLAHHAVMAQVGGGDQRRAVVAAGGQLGAGAEFEQHGQSRLVVGDSGDRDRVVAVVLERAEVGPGLGQCANDLVPAGKGRDMQRCAAMAVARAEQVAVGPGYLGCVAAPGGRVQTLVGRGLRRRRADLGRGGGSDQAEASSAASRVT